jgi:RNA polymerase sigma factor (sigma-70 family)
MQNVVVDRVPVRVRRPARLLRLASDEWLVALVRNGDEEAFEALYDRHNPAILGFCRHMLGSREEAEDAVQHTFLSAFRDLVRSDKPIELRPWLFAIARNRCLSLLRARRAHVELELAEPATDGLTATVEQREDLRELLADLASLPEDQRAALLLAELGALDHAGIATVLGCPREKVKALVFQARTSLASSREARATPCEQIRVELATASGGALRRGALRRHLRICAGCQAFKAEVATQRKLFALALPVVPSVALKASVLSGGASGASAAGGGGVAAATGATAGAGNGVVGGLLGTVASTGTVKVAVTLAVAGVVAGGGALTEQLGTRGHAPVRHDSAPSGVDRSSTAPAGVRGASPAYGPSSRARSERLGHNALLPPLAQAGTGQHRPTRTASPTPRVPQLTPAGNTPPGQTTTPPGQATTPPGQAGTPPGQAKNGSGGTGTTPGHGGTPSGQGGTPPGQAKNGSGGTGTPPGQGGAPPGQGGTPPGQAKQAPGQGGEPPRGTGGDASGGASGDSGSAPGYNGGAHGQNG